MAIVEGRLRPIDGAVPVIVTFHDTNTFTAPTCKSTLPFYNEGEEIQRVAGLRAESAVYAGPP